MLAPIQAEIRATNSSIVKLNFIALECFGDFIVFSSIIISSFIPAYHSMVYKNYTLFVLLKLHSVKFTGLRVKNPSDTAPPISRIGHFHL